MSVGIRNKVRDIKCVCCQQLFSSAYCATSLALLKAMMFDRIKGHSCLDMPRTDQSLSSSSYSSLPGEQGALVDREWHDVLLPLCDSGLVRPDNQLSKNNGHRHITSTITRPDGSTMSLDDTFCIETTHWICASCMGKHYVASPSLACRQYASVVSVDGAKTTTTSRKEKDTDCSVKSDNCDMMDGRYASGPTVAALGQDVCPQCQNAVSSAGISMFLVILESQYCDYTRMQNCWLNECTRNVRLRKLIRDLQHYLLFDKSVHVTHLRLERTPHAYRVNVDREVDVPHHQKTDICPDDVQIESIGYTAVRPRTRDQLEIQDSPPSIVSGMKRLSQYTGDMARDHVLHEPRERWLFEALGLHHDFDEATMPINAQALTKNEQRALRRALRKI